MRTLRLLFVFLALSLHLFVGQAIAEGRPNFIVILADDLGYGDLGCYGSVFNETPNLDRLAAEGVRFTDFHSNGPMCTPTRAALLTGLYQQRFGRKFESALSGKEHYSQGLPLESLTLAEVLKGSGYATGCFGKWHLGYQPPYLPVDHGFDEFRGLASGDGDHHSHIDRSGRPDWWHNNRPNPESGYTADLLVEHAMTFIEKHQKEPFFVYLPHLAIHFPWQGPSDPPHRKEGQDYWDDKWGVISDPSNVRPHIKAMVESIDRGVGEMVALLKRLGIEKDTLVFFLSDNGGYTHYGNSHKNISSNGLLRGQKTELFEGGHRVPAIAWWPGRIRPAISNSVAITFDLMPTIVSLSKGEISPEFRFDGVDLSPVLFRTGRLVPRTLFWRMDDETAIRRGPWKWIRKGRDEPQLYDLVHDLGETRDMRAEHPSMVAELAKDLALWERTIENDGRMIK
ncbi:sulfatase-like hydrolase/transferase [bacterium]|jgi:arylsulfatase A|nr:sulfatase-like hydrolase/transferase [Verrucomicrobiota bacterium]MDA7497224.1 sulfatase-like hydrolase/transferase [bacterium]